MTELQWAELTLNEKLSILNKCNGKHYDLDEIFNCDSCNVIFLGGDEL
jgi:hypothetical protein